MIVNFEVFHNHKFSDARRENFRSFTARNVNNRNDVVNNEFPMNELTLEPHLISSIPNSIDNIHQTIFNYYLALWGPIIITYIPNIS